MLLNFTASFDEKDFFVVFFRIIPVVAFPLGSVLARQNFILKSTRRNLNTFRAIEFRVVHYAWHYVRSMAC